MSVWWLPAGPGPNLDHVRDALAAAERTLGAVAALLDAEHHAVGLALENWAGGARHQTEVALARHRDALLVAAAQLAGLVARLRAALDEAGLDVRPWSPG